MAHFSRSRTATRRVLAAVLLVVGAVTAATAPSGAQGQTLQVQLHDDRGVPIFLAAPPRRIVSLLPSLTETVCALGACDRLVGTDRFSNWPDSVAALPKLGGIEDAQIERVVALKPDVVLASTSARVTDRLEALGLKVIALESQDEADVKRMLALLGQVLGTRKKAEQVWADIDRVTRAAAARVPVELRGKRVYFEIDATPYAAGPSSFIGETLAHLGMANAISADLGRFPRLNPELVVRTQPDIVMAVKAAIAEMPKRPGWSALRALNDGQTCGFPGPTYELIIRPGPRMGEAASALADCLVSIARAEGK